MAVFNSLGSNYNLDFALHSLQALIQSFFGVDQDKDTEVVQQLEKSSNSSIVLTYKGRHAITLALQEIGIKPGDNVAIQAFTCWAVEEALHSSEVVPVFVDLDKDKLNMSLSTLKEAYSQTKDIKAVILQHTFGFTAEVEKIEIWCRTKKIKIIHDLAHAYGSQTNEGKDLQLCGDALAYSFGRDKVVDAISGGAVSLRKKEVQTKLTSVSEKQIQTDLIYPILTWIIRSTYTFGLGKAIHYVSIRLGLLTSPIANSFPEPAELPTEHTRLLKRAIKANPSIQKHRQSIATIYDSQIEEAFKLPNLDISSSSCLRYPIRVGNRQDLIKVLKDGNFYLSDTWFKSVVEMGRLKKFSMYTQGSCSNAELMANQIFNLPTHQNVTKNQAREIVEIINKHARSR